MKCRSVLDLSMRPPGSLDMSHSPSQPSSPSSGGLGDLRNISRKAWSRSVDDLGKFPSAVSSPIDGSFHNKITQYRNRSNSNTTISASPVPARVDNPTNMHQPFPTIITTSALSSSDADSGHRPKPGVSISISSPASLDKPLPHGLGQPAQVHNRSHSFTPKLPSKLSAQKLGFGPQSPKRKGSGHAEQEIEKETAALADAKGVFGGPNSVARTNTPPPHARATVMPAPPTILEPAADDDEITDNSGSKRTSQIVYNSGFINRLTELPASHHPFHAPSLTLSKGWKPFKLELKGSKLFFYKPPGDRATAVRDLFPVTLVSALEEDEEERESEQRMDQEMLAPRNMNGREEGAGIPVRKKRAYWGRGTHPELIHGIAGVEKGTFEALVHEAVFATTFSKAPADVDTQEVQDEAMAQWRDFASAILLCFPALVGPAKFENEFTRCCAYFVSGAGGDTEGEARSRVTWLAGEYLRCHGGPTEVSEWEQWRADTIPDFWPPANNGPVAGGISTSSSMQALYARTPNLAADSPAVSSNLGTFSPRPETDNKMVSLMDALAGPPAPSGRGSSYDQQRPDSICNPRIWAALEDEGLSREVLLALDPQLIATSLGLFHRTALQEIPENLTAEYIIGSEGANNHKGLGPVADTPQDQPTTPHMTLFGSERSPHWLTKILLMQILGVDTSTGSLTSPQASFSGRPSEDRPLQTSRTHSRSEVISMWAKVGELCRLTGDECSWRAIAAALCSRPVARLDKAWKRVNSDALNIVASWVDPGADGECASVQDPRITPWGGDVKDKIKENFERSRDCNGQWWLVRPLANVREMFEGTRTAFSLCPRRVSLEDSSTREDATRMMAFWAALCAGNIRSGTLGSKFFQ